MANSLDRKTYAAIVRALKKGDRSKAEIAEAFSVKEHVVWKVASHAGLSTGHGRGGKSARIDADSAAVERWLAK